MSGWRDERGCSLAELLVALAVLALVLTAATTIQRSVLQAYVVGSNQTEAQQNARAALERIARHIREATTPLAAGSTAQSLIFTLPDPVTGISIPGVQVTYAFVGNALQCTGLCDDQTISAEPVTVIGRAQVPPSGFVCRDASDTPGACGPTTRRVEITIRTSSEDTVVAGGIADTRAELTTSVQLRNL
jgi:prepilin-type N-terminal cleavage/methylation domain-containing protein